MKQSVHDAATAGKTQRYSDQGLAALADVILESILSDTLQKGVKVSEVREMVGQFFGASPRKASFVVIAAALDSHPWLTKTSENTFRIQREFDKLPQTEYY